MKHLLAFLGGMLAELITNQNTKIESLMAEFTALKEYIAKNIVTVEQVDELVSKEVAAATATFTAANATLATDILAEAKAYTDSVDVVDDAAMQAVSDFANKIAEKVNALGAVVGTEVPPVAPPVAVPVETPPADAPTATPI